MGHIRDLVSNSSRNRGCYHPFAKICSPYSSLHPGNTEWKWISSKWISTPHSNRLVPSLLQTPTDRPFPVLVALTLHRALMECGFGRGEKSIISSTRKAEGTRLTESQNNSFSPLTAVWSQAPPGHKDEGGCCWWLTGKGGVAGKRFVSFHSDLCYQHHWPVGGESQGGRKAMLLFYSYVLFSWLN